MAGTTVLRLLCRCLLMEAQDMDPTLALGQPYAPLRVPVLHIGDTPSGCSEAVRLQRVGCQGFKRCHS